MKRTRLKYTQERKGAKGSLWYFVRRQDGRVRKVPLPGDPSLATIKIHLTVGPPK